MCHPMGKKHHTSVARSSGKPLDHNALVQRNLAHNQRIRFIRRMARMQARSGPAWGVCRIVASALNANEAFALGRAQHPYRWRPQRARLPTSSVQNAAARRGVGIRIGLSLHHLKSLRKWRYIMDQATDVIVGRTSYGK